MTDQGTSTEEDDVPALQDLPASPNTAPQTVQDAPSGSNLEDAPSGSTLAGEDLSTTADGYQKYSIQTAAGTREVEVPTAETTQQQETNLRRAQEESQVLTEEREKNRLEQAKRGVKPRPIFRKEKWNEWLGKKE